MARSLTAGNKFSELLTPSAASQEAAEDDKALDHVVADPQEDEQRADVRIPEDFQPDAPVPEVPDLSQVTPSAATRLPDGAVSQTYERDGVTYTVNRSTGGQVTTTFEKDGVNYESQDSGSGGSSFRMWDESEDGNTRYEREITTDPEGRETESSSVDQVYTDRLGRQSSQSRTVTAGPDGQRTVTEDVHRPDGGVARFERVEQPDGTSSEVYEYTQNDLKVQRTTAGQADGSSATRREVSYSTAQDIEELTGTPAVPGAAPVAPADFPQDGRGETQVTEVEEYTTDTRNRRTETYGETTYSQTSDDVSVDPDKFGNRGVVVGDGSVTRTVSNIQVPGRNGQLMPSRSVASQAVTLDVHGQSGEGRITLSDHWSSTGEASTGVRAEGFEGQDLTNLLSGSENGDSLRIGDQHTHVFSGNEQDSYLQAIQNPDASKLLGLSGGNRSVDFANEVGYNADGTKISDTTVFGQLEPGEDGRSVTVSSQFSPSEGSTPAHWTPKTWVYSDVSNDGDDFRRQTVIEGTEISTLETRTSEPNGAFSYSSVTHDGETEIARASSSREVLTDGAIEQALQDGELTEEQARRLLQSQEPRWLERTGDSAERYEKNDELAQNGYSSSSFRFSGADGYEVGEIQQSQNNEDGEASSSTLSLVTDPSSKSPFQGRLVTKEPGDFARFSDIRIDNQGRFWRDNNPIGNFDLKGDSVSDYIQATGGSDGLVRGFLDAAGGSGVLEGAVGRLNSAFEGYRLVKAFRNGDTAQGFASGAELLAEHSEEVAGLFAKFEGKGGLPGKLSVLGKAGKLFGLAGGFANLGFGAYDAFTADTTTGKVAGGLAAASGAALITGAFFGPPGWVIGGIASGVLGLASAVVGASEGVSRSHTEPLDSGF